MDHVVIFCTAPPDQAPALARALLDQRLIACATIVSGRSLFRWQGAVEEEEEALLVIKSRADRWDNIRETICHLHPYDTPEIIALPVVDGLPAYLAWIDEVVADGR
ncbi:MAG: divalent-cation tolerance protein CutA [Candidatus Thermoplasmatota archaeon]|nr:divalent-cation tolerance protein CutA [Candidatus Thermoplasmatota archaeon]